MIKRGTEKLMGDNIKVVRVEFSTLGGAALIHNAKRARMYTVKHRVENVIKVLSC
jgi:hypothetical protein